MKETAMLCNKEVKVARKRTKECFLALNNAGVRRTLQIMRKTKSRQKK